MVTTAAAYLLLEALRRIGLQGTQLARGQVGTIRLRLLSFHPLLRQRQEPALSSKPQVFSQCVHVCTWFGCRPQHALAACRSA